MAMMSAPRRTIVPHAAFLRESVIATPTMNRKNGKMRSVGVHPFHAACSSGQ
jgi:hypothetical protein